MANEFVVKNGLIVSSGNVSVTGSVTAYSFTGSIASTNGVISSSAQITNLGIIPVGSTASISFPLYPTLYSISPAAGTNFNTYASIILGVGAGTNTTTSQEIVAIGTNAGYGAALSAYSVFIGQNSGFNSSGSAGTVFVGQQAGMNAFDSDNAVLIGPSAGSGITTSDNAVVIGLNSGEQSVNALSSTFIGESAGAFSTNSSGSNFIGYNAGINLDSAYSNIIGFRAGYNVMEQNNLGQNNIIIGSNITLPAGRKDSINIGGIIFGTGSNLDLSNGLYAVSGSTNGKIGINVVTPTRNFEVSGSVAFPSLTNSIQPNLIGYNSSTGQLFFQTPAESLPTGVISGSSQLTSSFDLRYSLSGSSTAAGPNTFDFNLDPEAAGTVNFIQDSTANTTAIARTGSFDIEISSVKYLSLSSSAMWITTGSITANYMHLAKYITSAGDLDFNI